jgi:hypothetical protein
MPPDPETQLQASESIARVGAAENNPTQQAPDIQASGTPPEIQALVYSDLEKHVANLNSFAVKVGDYVGMALKERAALRWQQPDDDLFLPHTLLVKSVLGKPDVIRSGFGLLPTQVWIHGIWPLTNQAEEHLRRSDPHARIHKGAPLFNVALCFFVTGDFDRAFQYFTAAGIEDELSGRGSRYLVPTGDNPLAERAIIRPLVQKLIPNWQRDYSSISAVGFDQAELKALLNWLVQRAPDAFQTVTALHRLRLHTGGLDNEAARYQMVRALADIVLAIESSLRRWQAGVDGPLHTRMDALLKANPASHSNFTSFHTDFTNTWSKAQRETGLAVNWVISEALSRLAVRPSVAERIGIAAYLAVRLRNSLMHVNEETLDVHNNPQLSLRVAGIAFAVLRVSKHGNENTLSAL